MKGTFSEGAAVEINNPSFPRFDGVVGENCRKYPHWTSDYSAILSTELLVCYFPKDPISPRFLDRGQRQDKA